MFTRENLEDSISDLNETLDELRDRIHALETKENRTAKEDYDLSELRCEYGDAGDERDSLLWELEHRTPEL